MIKIFFEYHYYRIAKMNYKWDGRDAFTALTSVTSVQSLFIINILIFFQELIFNEPHRRLNFYEKISFLGIIVLVYFYNYKKYKGRYFEFRERWKDESKEKRIINGIVIVITIVLAWGLFFLNALMFDKFIEYGNVSK